jgi:hypothetical protein
MTNSTASLGLKLGGKLTLTPQVPSAGSPGWVAGDPVVQPQIWPNTLDGPYIVNGVIQSQPPHVYAPALLPTSSYFWASIR